MDPFLFYTLCGPCVGEETRSWSQYNALVAGCVQAVHQSKPFLVVEDFLLDPGKHYRIHLSEVFDMDQTNQEFSELGLRLVDGKRSCLEIAKIEYGCPLEKIDVTSQLVHHGRLEILTSQDLFEELESSGQRPSGPKSLWLTLRIDDTLFFQEFSLNNGYLSSDLKVDFSRPFFHPLPERNQYEDALQDPLVHKIIQKVKFHRAFVEESRSLLPLEPSKIHLVSIPSPKYSTQKIIQCIHQWVQPEDTLLFFCLETELQILSILKDQGFFVLHAPSSWFRYPSLLPIYERILWSFCSGIYIGWEDTPSINKRIVEKGHHRIASFHFISSGQN